MRRLVRYKLSTLFRKLLKDRCIIFNVGFEDEHKVITTNAIEFNGQSTVKHISKSSTCFRKVMFGASYHYQEGMRVYREIRDHNGTAIDSIIFKSHGIFELDRHKEINRKP